MQSRQHRQVIGTSILGEPRVGRAQFRRVPDVVEPCHRAKSHPGQPAIDPTKQTESLWKDSTGTGAYPPIRIDQSEALQPAVGRSANGHVEVTEQHDRTCLNRMLGRSVKVPQRRRFEHQRGPSAPSGEERNAVQLRRLLADRQTRVPRDAPESVVSAILQARHDYRPVPRTRRLHRSSVRRRWRAAFMP